MYREEAEQLLSALIFDDLDEASKTELLNYLQTDDELRERLADMRMAVKVTSDAVQHGPDPVLGKQRLKRLAKLAGRGSTRPTIFTIRRLAAAAAVLVVIALPCIVVLNQMDKAEPGLAMVLEHEPEHVGFVVGKYALETSEERYNKLATTGQPSQGVASSGVELHNFNVPAYQGQIRGGDIVNGAVLQDGDFFAKADMPEIAGTQAPASLSGESQSHRMYALDREGSRRNVVNYVLPPDTTYARGGYGGMGGGYGGFGYGGMGEIGGYAGGYGGMGVMGGMAGNGGGGYGGMGGGGRMYAYNGRAAGARSTTSEDSGAGYVTLQGGRGEAAGSSSSGGPVTHDTPGIITVTGPVSAGTSKAISDISVITDQLGVVLEPEAVTLLSAQKDMKHVELSDELREYVPGDSKVDVDFEMLSAKAGTAKDEGGLEKPTSFDTAFGTTGELGQRSDVSKQEGLEWVHHFDAVPSTGLPEYPEEAPRLQREAESPADRKPEADHGYATSVDGSAIEGWNRRQVPVLGDLPMIGRMYVPEGFVGEVSSKEEIAGDKFDNWAFEPQARPKAVESQTRAKPDAAGPASGPGADEKYKRETRPEEEEMVQGVWRKEGKARQWVDGDDWFDVSAETHRRDIDSRGKEVGVEIRGLDDPSKVEQTFPTYVKSTAGFDYDVDGRVDESSPVEHASTRAGEDVSDLPAAARFKLVPVNPWVMTRRDALSTFALDVDTASYALCRRYIQSGFLPPQGAVRMEEFINYFDYDYPQRANHTFAVHAEAAKSPFAGRGENLTLLKIGVKARTIGRDQRKSAHLVFVIDTSASMDQPDRLGLVQEALGLLVDRLSAADRVTLITCANEARLHLEAVSAREREKIHEAINAVQPSGPTNLLAGLKLGYATARRLFSAKQVNHVVLCSDGVANIGQTEADAVLREVAADRKQGITITCVGVGYGSYNDAFLEGLANRGDGSYVFLDSARQARRVFVEQLAATLHTVAKDARIQVKFNPDMVRRYRLIGYENRDIEDKRFRDDTVDAGEVGSGQCSTALYELELTGQASANRDAELGTVFVRYRDVETGRVEEISSPLTGAIVRRRTIKSAPRFFLAATAARFAELLRESEHARHGNLTDVSRVVEQVSLALPLDRDVRELAELIRKAEHLPRAP